MQKGGCWHFRVLGQVSQATRFGAAVEAAAVADRILHFFQICHAEALFRHVLALVTCLNTGTFILLEVVEEGVDVLPGLAF